MRAKIRRIGTKTYLCRLNFAYVHSHYSHGGGHPGRMAATRTPDTGDPPGCHAPHLAAALPAWRGGRRQRAHHPQPAHTGAGSPVHSRGHHFGQRAGGVGAVESGVGPQEGGRA